MQATNFNLLYFLLPLLLIGACTPMEEEAPEVEDKILAKVFNKSLYLSELRDLVPEGSTKADSSLTINAHVERWVRENLLLHEAEQNIPKDVNIDQLVRDYRASLIQHSYEKLLIELQLDSTVSKQEMTAFYEENKDQYKLDNRILSCFFMKIPLIATDLDKLKSYWKENNNESYLKMLEYSSNNATIYMLEEEAWYDFKSIAAQFPEDRPLKWDEVVAKRKMSFKNGEHEYFINIKDYMSANRVAPMEYIKDQLSKVILHKRKIKLLKDKKEEIYERESNRKNITIYTY